MSSSFLERLVQCWYDSDEVIVSESQWAVLHYLIVPTEDQGNFALVQLRRFDAFHALLDFHSSQFVRLLYSPSLSILCPTLKIINHMVSREEDRFTQKVLDMGLLPFLTDLLAHPSEWVRRHTCYALGNIMAGTRTQVLATLEVPQLFSCIVDLIQKEEDQGVFIEAGYVLANAAGARIPELTQALVEHKAIYALMSLIAFTCIARTIEDFLTALLDIIIVNRNEALKQLRQCDLADVGRFITPDAGAPISTRARKLLLLAVSRPCATSELCSICLDVGGPKTLMLQACGHKYHWNCILEWIGKNPSCPLCRRILTIN